MSPSRSATLAIVHLLDILPDAVIMVDAAGCIVYVNPAVQALLGYGPSELLNQPLATLVPPEDALLLDSGNLSLSVKELGGTGRTHDWTLSRRIRDAICIPLFLAGGLKPSNVAEAIAADVDAARRRA